MAAWFHKSETAATLDELDHSPSWIKPIGMKLYQALVGILRNARPKGQKVLYKVERMTNAAYERQKVVRGRHVVWLIRDSMKSFDATKTTFGYEHLSKVAIKPNPQTGDLEQFLKTWDWILDSMDGAMKNGAPSVSSSIDQ